MVSAAARRAGGGAAGALLLVSISASISVHASAARAQAPAAPPPSELSQLLLPPEARDKPPEPAFPRVTLDDAVHHALARNPSVQVAQADIARFHGLMRQLRASSLPSVVLTGTYTRLDNDRILGTGDQARVIAGADQLNGTATVSVPLVAPSRWMQWLHAEDSVKVAEINVADVQRQIAAATARAYLAVLAQTRVVEVAERLYTVTRAHYDYALQRLRGGVGTRLDEVRAAQELYTSEAQLASGRAALYRTREALGVLMGVDGPVDVAGEPELSAPGTQLSELAEDAPVLRADLRLLQARAWATSRLVRHSFADYLPTVLGTFSPFFQNPPTLTQPLVGWQAQIGLSWALYDGGLRYGLRAERQALYNQAKLQVQGTTRQAKSEVRAAAESAAQAGDASTAARRASARADEALELATIAYRAGATTNLEVIDAERRARDAATLATQADDAVRQARLDLLIAAGYFPR